MHRYGFQFVPDKTGTNQKECPKGIPFGLQSFMCHALRNQYWRIKPPFKTGRRGENHSPIERVSIRSIF